MIERGMIRQTPPDEAVEKVAREIVEARVIGREVVAVSSVHRISEALAERVHDLHVERSGRESQTSLAVHVKRDLQPAELRSSQFYKAGDVVEYKQADAVGRALVTSVLPHALVVENRPRPLPLGQVRAVFDLSRIERGPGEKLLLQEKVKQNDRTFEKGSRQTISHVSGGTVHFASGLKLGVDDGRVRQGDCLTDYKAQGIKGAEVRGIEDNGSAMAMANKEAFHVKGTRHVQNVVLHVENKGLYVEAIQRNNVKFSALQLERVPESRREVLSVSPPAVDKGRLLMQIRSWGKEFLPRIQGHKLAEQIRHQLSRFEALRPRVVEVAAEKITPPAAKEAVTQKLTPTIQETPREKPVPKLTTSIKEMMQNFQTARREHVAQKQKVSSAPRPAVKQKQSRFHTTTVHRPRHGQGMGL
jgi:hypothetical protein